MITTQKLVDGFGLNLRLINLQTEGLNHEDSLIQTPYNINCLNWVLGHITVNRDNVLELLGIERLLGEAQTMRYKRGSEPIKAEDPDILPLEKLLEALKRSQEKLEAAILALREQEPAEEIQLGQVKMSLAERLFGFYFHDTYHTGQTDLLRQIAGKNDKVI